MLLFVGLWRLFKIAQQVNRKDFWTEFKLSADISVSVRRACLPDGCQWLNVSVAEAQPATTKVLRRYIDYC